MTVFSFVLFLSVTHPPFAGCRDCENAETSVRGLRRHFVVRCDLRVGLGHIRFCAFLILIQSRVTAVFFIGVSSEYKQFPISDFGSIYVYMKCAMGMRKYTRTSDYV